MSIIDTSAVRPDFMNGSPSRRHAGLRSSSQWEGPFCPPSRKACRARLAYLCTRIFLGHAGFQPDFRTDRPNRTELAELIQVPELADSKATPDEIYAALESAHVSGELYDPLGPVPVIGSCDLQRNLHWIRHTAQLSEVEYQLFELAVLFRVFSILGSLVGESAARSMTDHHFALAALLQLDPDAIKDALRFDSVLVRCALVSSMQHGEDSLNRYLRCPSVFATRLEQHSGPVGTLLQTVILPLQASHLDLAQFSYTQTNSALAQTWLAGALASAAKGEGAGHLLVVGEPGMGKTEWVRALLAGSSSHAMELAVFHLDGKPLSGSVRLQNLRMSMHFMRNTPQGVLLFDEADDIFRESTAGEADTEEGGVSMRTHRASLNHLLENAQLPVIWIMNDASMLDPAVLRRFDVVIRFQPMPRHTKRALLESHFGEECPTAIAPAELDRWAQIAALSPGLIGKLVDVRHKAVQAGLTMDAMACRQWLIQRIDKHHTRALQAKEAPSFVWNPETVNASMDLAALTQGIRRHPHARVLLYGIPGTGKTAYAKALAQALGHPLHEHRASDLLSAFVGGSEEQIQAAFHFAQVHEAVLFLDEADGLLASRDGATRNWEVTQVNELLVQLHDFEGVVVLATNRMDYMDEAVLRRMDAKVEMLPLRPEQAQTLLLQCLRDISGQDKSTDFALSPQQKSQLQRLYPLTPGDFAMLQRRQRFAPAHGETVEAICTELLQLLEQEVRLKSGSKASIGFVPGTSYRDVHATPKALS
jgi:transitional endoplasmic reticulum ATPase